MLPRGFGPGAFSVFTEESAALRKLPDRYRWPTSVLNLLLVGGIGWTAASGARTWFEELTSSPPPAVAITKFPPADPVSIDTILTAKLFGSAGPASAETAAIRLDDPSLRLLGILQASRSEQSRALIARALGSSEDSFAVGDEVQPGLRLEQVHALHVVLRRQAQHFELRLDAEDEGIDLGEGRRAALEQPTAEDDADAELPDLAQLRTAVLQQPQQIAQFLRFEAASDAGGRKGYYLYPGRQAAGFFSINLQPGDLLVAVNDIPLTDAARTAQAIEALRSSSQLHLGLQRAGQPISVVVDLN